jgi:hypothetical protein
MIIGAGTRNRNGGNPGKSVIPRVAFSVVAFALQRDRTYVVVTLIVLAVLLYGLTRVGP